MNIRNKYIIGGVVVLGASTKEAFFLNRKS